MFNALPEGALVVAPWITFPTLLYFQRVHGLRADLTLILGTAEPRNYDHGRVNGFVPYVRQEIDRRPVALARLYPELQESFSLLPVAGLEGWYLLGESLPGSGISED